MLRFTKIEEESIPRKYNKLKAEIGGFLSMNVKVAKIECGNDYKNTKAAVGTFRNCIRRYGFPIDVIQRKDEIYFARRDM
jgi:hypothetical protein